MILIKLLSQHCYGSLNLCCDWLKLKHASAVLGSHDSLAC